jgi:hypothetical protein
LKFSNFCKKCGKPFTVCLCLTVAGVGFAKVDPLAKQPPAHALGAVLTAGATGTVGPVSQMVVHDQVTGQRITALLPNQRAQPALGPTGTAGNSWRSEVASVTGPTGPAGGSKSELPKGPTGATG